MSGPTVIVCSAGCCPGCQDCFGMSIGCHQNPCRCDLVCTCRYEDEDAEGVPYFRAECERHDDRGDTRHDAAAEPDWDPADETTTDDPCPECGEVGPCGYDAEGRALIHRIPEDES